MSDTRALTFADILQYLTRVDMTALTKLINDLRDLIGNYDAAKIWPLIQEAIAFIESILSNKGAALSSMDPHEAVAEEGRLLATVHQDEQMSASAAAAGIPLGTWVSIAGILWQLVKAWRNRS